MKKFLKIFAILFLGVFLMAGTSFSTPYADPTFAAYEYYQAVEGQTGVEYDATYDVAYDEWVSGSTASFSFDLINFSNVSTDSDLDMIDDVGGWGPGGIPISNAFVSFTLFSTDSDMEGFNVDLNVFLDDQLAYDVTLGIMDISSSTSPLITFNIPMTDALLTAWQNNPDGVLTINAFVNPFGGYNDLGIVEAGIGVNSNPVPEPSTILLLGSGLLGLVGYNRKRFSKKG